jgi:hypothetical protein
MLKACSDAAWTLRAIHSRWLERTHRYFRSRIPHPGDERRPLSPYAGPWLTFDKYPAQPGVTRLHRAAAAG